MDFNSLTIEKLQAGIKKGDFSFLEVAMHFLKNIEEKNKNLNAYLEVFGDVQARAKKMDEGLKKSSVLNPLAGAPLAIKDNILIKGKTATSASKILEGYKAPYWSTVAKKLDKANALFLGRTNMDEFAMGSSTENSAFGVVRNPHDTKRVSGGSSGGSAAAVASGMALASLGSDTGGSVRQPASFCGVVGLKPTYGSVSRYGLMAMGSSLDVIGPITKTVADSKLVYEAIKGKDKMDSTSVSESDYGEPKTERKEKLKVGVPEYLEDFDLSKELKKTFYKNLDKLKDRGFEIKKVNLPNLKYALAVYYIIMPAEVSTNLARFDGIKYGAKMEGKNLMEDYLKTRGELFGKEVRRRIFLGTYVLSAGYRDAYYKKAKMVRDLIIKDYKRVFNEIDVIATPTVPTPAFKTGEKVNPLSMYMTDIFTVPANLAGTPAISVPMGKVSKEKSNLPRTFSTRKARGLPVGIQFTAPHMREDLLFQAGEKLEK